MAFSEAIGIIELVGLAAAIECADAAVKAANVKLLGYELSKGLGLVTVKISGNVGAVQAAVAAGSAAAAKVGQVAGKIIIPRPHRDLEKLIKTPENVLYERKSTASTPEGNDPEGSGTDGEEAVTEAENAILSTAPPASAEAADQLGEGTETEALEASVDQADNPVDTAGDSADQSEDMAPAASCNICSDPVCPRRKGEPHTNCIHYGHNRE